MSNYILLSTLKSTSKILVEDFDDFTKAETKSVDNSIDLDVINSVLIDTRNSVVKVVKGEITPFKDGLDNNLKTWRECKVFIQ